MNLINKTGTLALATRMQKLGDAIRKEASQIYKEQGIEFESKWFPVVYLLTKKSPMTIAELAAELGYAHPSVIALVKELQSKKLLRSAGDKNDARKRLLFLTPKAHKMVKKMQPIWKKMSKVGRSISDNKNNLIRAIEEAEAQLEKENFYERMQKLLRQK